jgi:ferredoxin
MATILYKDAAIPAERGQDVLGAIVGAGKPISYLCMSGSCGMCRVTVSSGADQLAPLAPAERFHCKGFTGKDGEARLAYQAVVLGTGVVTVEQ